jgi:hypothetical protein
VALASTTLTFLLSVRLFVEFDPTRSGYQFVETAIRIRNPLPPLIPAINRFFDDALVMAAYCSARPGWPAAWPTRAG